MKGVNLSAVGFEGESVPFFKFGVVMKDGVDREGSFDMEMNLVDHMGHPKLAPMTGGDVIGHIDPKTSYQLIDAIIQNGR